MAGRALQGVLVVCEILDRVQLLSPYRGGPSGALGLSEFMRMSYRAEAREAGYKQTDGFVHSDKIVRKALARL